jgi:subtilisin family serine protease
MSLGGVSRSRAEEAAFDRANANGVLSVAAAGNDRNKKLSYPASYPSVVSVAAVDRHGVIADFSQYNAQVELAGPGVNVLSTVPMGTAPIASVTVDGMNYAATGMEGSPGGTATGKLVDCGLGDGKSPCIASGGICLIQRGDITFASKVEYCQAIGGMAAIIYNNVDDLLSGTIAGSSSTIPAVGISGLDGAMLKTKTGSSTTVTLATSGGNYELYSGTSMATPHVSAVAALVWSHHPECSNQEIRDALASTAEDKGSPGRDTYYGYGIVKAKDAVDYLDVNGCIPAGDPPTDDPHCGRAGDSCANDGDCCDKSCKGNPGSKTCK